MKKILATAAIGLLAAAPSWSLSFNWLNGGPQGVTPVNISATTAGLAFGGDPFRFVTGGGPFTAVGDVTSPGVSHAAPHIGAANGVGDFVSIFAIGSIAASSFPNTPFFNTGGDTDFEIFAILSGLEDDTSTMVSGATATDEVVQVQSKGGRLELYLVDDSEGLWDNILISSIGWDGSKVTFPGITDVGVPFVAFELTERDGGANDGFTDVREINLTDPDTEDNNNGQFYADVDTDWDNYLVYGKAFDTDAISTISGDIDGADLQFEYTMNAAGTGPGELPLAFNPAGGNSAIQPIPEPSTLLLLGTGLLGMVGYARRRRS